METWDFRFSHQEKACVIKNVSEWSRTVKFSLLILFPLLGLKTTLMQEEKMTPFCIKTDYRDDVIEAFLELRLV